MQSKGRLLSLLLLGMFLIGVVSAHGQVKPATSMANASFLSRRFLTDTRNAATLTDDFLARARNAYSISVLFPNGGLLTASGNLDHAPFAVKLFLDRVSVHERSTGTGVMLMPYLNGYSWQDTAHAANQRLDLNNPAVRSQIVAECLRYVSARVPGSYVSGSGRVFDGIVLDIEPAGDPAFLASFQILLAEIRNAFVAEGLVSTKIGIAAPQYTERLPKPNWGWDSSDYYHVSRHVDLVIAMTYDSGLTAPGDYQPWMNNQTANILRAVSGAQWNFDGEHPQPTNAVKVLIGLPGFYTVSKAHNPDVEDVAHGAPGIWEALSTLSAKDPATLAHYQGAVMYSHDGGTPDSPYARYDRDWAEWRTAWLAQR